LGKRGINTLAQQDLTIRACLQQYVPQRRWIAAAQHAAFYAEGSAVFRRLHWAQSQSLEALGIEAELSTAEVRPDGVEPLIGAMRHSLDQLNTIHAHLLLTVVHAEQGLGLPLSAASCPFIPLNVVRTMDWTALALCWCSTRWATDSKTSGIARCC
jgi:hypothetical protein